MTRPRPASRTKRFTWGDLAAALARRWPAADAAPWDNPGLQAGDPDRPARRALAALDLTAAVIDEAARLGCDGIVAHHPLIFRPLKSARADRHPEGLLLRLLERKLNFLAVHTNLDTAPDGPSFEIARRLGLSGLSFLEPTRREERMKIVTTLPAAAEAAAREALGRAGAGVFGEYERCTFSSPGIGRFAASARANPAAGRAGADNAEPELRLECTVDAGRAAAAREALAAAHPYETPVIELYPLAAGAPVRGFGAAGLLPAPEPLDDFARRVMGALRLSGVALVRGRDPVRKVAVVTGSGMSTLEAACAAGCDLLVTGDVKHHDAVDAAARGLSIVDAGHFGTEAVAREILARAVAEASGGVCAASVSAAERDPLERLSPPSGGRKGARR